MLTHKDFAETYNKLVSGARSMQARVKNVLAHHQDSRFVADYFGEIVALIDVLEERVNEVLRLEKLSEETGTALERSHELYRSMRKIFGAMLLYEIPSEVRRMFFPRGIPREDRLPLETLRVMGNLLCVEKDQTLSGYKKIHPLIDEIRFHLEDSRSLAVAEASLNSEAVIARSLLHQANASLDSALSVMVHLAKADNVFFPGLYKAIYGLASPAEDLHMLGGLEADTEGIDDEDDMEMEGSED